MAVDSEFGEFFGDLPQAPPVRGDTAVMLYQPEEFGWEEDSLLAPPPRRQAPPTARLSDVLREELAD